MDRWAARPIACGIVASCVLFISQRAQAQEAEAKAEKEQEPPKEAQAEERARLDLGLGLMGGWGAGTGNAAGAAGGAGLGGLMPTVHATGELHLAGPVWLVVRAQGGYASWETDGVGGSSWNVGGSLGPLVETPVFDFADVGGYLLVGGSYGRSADDTLRTANAQIGGVAGVSVHFRATRFFGVRLLLDVLEAGHAWSGYGPPTDGTFGSNTYARVTAQPSMELTFTF
jgi:hypothetical protein